MTITERTFVSADDTQIYAESAGNSAKPAIVFIHGLASSGVCWDNQFSDPALLRDFHLVRYDLRGHGRSGKPLDPKSYESIRFAEDFKAVCDGFGCSKPFLAGWSLGGSVVVDVVAAYGPSFLSGVLYIGGGILSLTKYHPLCAPPLIGDLIPLFFSANSDDVSSAAEKFVDSCAAPGKPLPFSERLKWLGAFVLQPRTVRCNHLSRTQPYEVWEQQARDLPVLIVQGTADQHCLYENMIRLARSVYREVEVKIIDGCGHSPAVEYGAETNIYIYEWTRDIAARQKPSEYPCAL
ncbi:alpha/beta-hydrolase [Trametes versicolor FP-101664 SS1]|uniref:alpha/beta-hydrolase n=1 Tax=Trametes versicolor (strain FP-101664) TaxID=717944 RepID=UPI000462193A|nr:alpha/beta-hydrolase [Trametes versicolor FP-101664 SS1]EIW57297.1 alpha/beta-hydrolase [Trametes versicolor FP-101664 SS1]